MKPDPSNRVAPDKNRHYVLHAYRHARKWVDFSPSKVQKYRQRWGDDFCLVIMGNPSDEEDFYAIPWGQVAHVFVDANTYPAKGNRKSKIWKIYREGTGHVFKFALAPDGPRERPQFDAAQWYGNRDALGSESVMDGVRMPVVSAVPSYEASEEPLASGAGFGQSEENRKVEEAAVHLVSEQYRQEGWQVVSVEAKRCGFDLLCVRDREEVHVEVKGVAGTDRRFVITARELRCAFDDDQFVLALVTSALSSQPVLERLPAQVFRRTFAFDPIQYWANPVTADARKRKTKGSGTVVP